MANLEPIFQRFERRLDVLETVFKSWLVVKHPKLRDEDLMFLEGLVSTLWQHWSLFCRRVVFASALGCQNRAGDLIQSCVIPRTWERVSHIASRAKNGNNPQPTGLNTDLKKEPTWGDVIKIQSIILKLAPRNKHHLISCFGAVSRGPIHLQIVRNATAHRNHQTFNNVKNLRHYYYPKPIHHPVEVTIWTEPTSNDFALIAWIDEIRLVSDLITRL